MIYMGKFRLQAEYVKTVQCTSQTNDYRIYCKYRDSYLPFHTGPSCIKSIVSFIRSLMTFLTIVANVFLNTLIFLLQKCE